jgi:hypothetical protein
MFGLPSSPESFNELWSDQRAREAEAEQKRRETSLAELVDRVERLNLICMAMWSLMKEKTDLTEDDLRNRIQEIDLSDGVLDGRVRIAAGACPKCGRMMSSRFKRCLYCGEVAPDRDAFTPAGLDAHLVDPEVK